MDFSTVTDGAAKAEEVIGKAGLALAMLFFIDAEEEGRAGFPEFTSYKSRVLERGRAKAKRVEEKYGKVA